jgi:6-pyruvoyltetrahydropterin/6-carboxytetrahydropterin synthase
MYSLGVRRDFIANHFLVGGDWGSENFPHAHHYIAEIIIQSSILDKHGYLVDIVEVEAALDKVIGYFRDSLLNDKVEFTGLNPSIEHFSRIIHEKLKALINFSANSKVSIKLWENDTCWAGYTDL